MGNEFSVENNRLKVNDPDYKLLEIDRASIFNNKIECGRQMKTSIFKEEYKKAAKALEEIVKTSNIFSEFNNMITFIGEKGSGKTTILKSFINSLESKDTSENLVAEYVGLNRIKFEVLKIIDLNYTLDKGSIVSTILFNIYINFLKKIKFESYPWKKELEELFNDIFKRIEEFAKEDSNSLFSMNSSFIIQEQINEVIRKYLNYCNKDYLVISIDNINSLNNAQNIIKDLKKYFRCEKLILLTTLDKKVIDEGKVDIDEVGFCNNIIHIESINFMNVRLAIDSECLSNIPSFKGDNIFEQLKCILHRKLNYYINSFDNFKMVISSNIKKFINFLIFINSLNDICEQNEYVILRYIETEIKDMPLGGREMIILRNVLKLNINELNKYLLISLGELIIGKKKNGEISNVIEEFYTNIIKNKFKIRDEKVCIGDVITCIGILKSYKVKERDECFIELLKSLYTFRLLVEYNKNEESLMKVIGKDYVGDYFKMISNNDQFNSLIEINGRKCAEDLKSFFGYRKELFISVFEPAHDYNNYCSKFTYNDSNIFNEEDIYKQKYYRLRFLNILSYSVKNKPSFLLYVINIDYWMSVLEKLRNQLVYNNISEKEFLVRAIEYIRDIINEDKLINKERDLEINGEIEPKGIEEDSMIDEKDIEFLQNFDNELMKAQYLYTYNV